jgi:LysM repeat protein
MQATFSGTAIRADFSTAGGSPAGTLLITATDGRYEATVDGFARYGGQLNLHLGRSKDDICTSSGYEVIASEPLMQKTGFTAPIPFHPEQALNPNVFTVAAISDGDSTDLESDCVYNLLATATLNWQVPDTVPAFTAHDSGSRDGATGTVTLTPTGQLAAYVVADGDSINGITSRFGISVEQLWYLNPTRNSGESSTVQTGETLNLDLQNR